MLSTSKDFVARKSESKSLDLKNSFSTKVSHEKHLRNHKNLNKSIFNLKMPLNITNIT
jgi:hypothetical protein